MNKKGFTLIELLAAITVLGIIMLVAIPNVVGVIERNKKSTYVQDAKKLITLAEYKFRATTSIPKPENEKCLVMYLSYLDKTDLQDPPNGGEYLINDSYVIITKKGAKYTYTVQLIEKKDANYHGVIATDSLVLEDDAELMNVAKTNIKQTDIKASSCASPKYQ